jgi:hypothetical protein
MPTVTLDTNLVDDQTLVSTAYAAGFEVAHTTVTERELFESGVPVADGREAQIYETGIWGESIVGRFVWGSKAEATNLAVVLQIISDGSFPRARTQQFTEGQRRQLRDAMIFCAHLREKRDIFVTNDRKGFIANGRREKLEQRFGTKIYTAEEFSILCGETKRGTR